MCALLALLHRTEVKRILEWCKVHSEYRSYGYLFLLSYIFLLRLPSEGLPAAKGNGHGAARVFIEGDTLVMALARG